MIALWSVLMSMVALCMRFCPRRCRCCPSKLKGARCKWYWFYLWGQTVLMIREVVIITREEIWDTALIAAQAAMWCVLVATTIEVWDFSQIRHKSPKSIDQVLDMLLLPLNYGFLSVHCIRLMQDPAASQFTWTIVSATMSSADMWESWALWSVLKLFVTVVESHSRRSARALHRKATIEASRASRLANGSGNSNETASLSDQRPSTSSPLTVHDRGMTMSVEGAQVMDMSVEGPLAENTPEPSTVVDIHRILSNGIAYGSDDAPGLLKDDSVDVEHLQKQSREFRAVSAFEKFCVRGVQCWVLTTVCSASIDIFVKGILSIQFPTLCYWLTGKCQPCAEWYEGKVENYFALVTSVLCSAAICFVLVFERAFHRDLHPLEPYWKFWGVKSVVSVTYFQWVVLKFILRLDNYDTYFSYAFLICMELPFLCIVHIFKAYPVTRGPVPSEWLTCLFEHTSTSAKLKAPPQKSRADERWYQWLCRWLRIGFFTGLSLWWGVETSFYLIPETEKEHNQKPSATLYCKGFPRPPHHLGGDDLTLERLPLCGVSELKCSLGYRGNPKITCRADSQYDSSGSCSIVGCGAPPGVSHTNLHTTLRQERRGWTRGQQVQYSCEKGYKGNPVATCGNDGTFSVEGKCDLVGCGAVLPEVGHATRIVSSDEKSQSNHLHQSYAGERFEFECEKGFRGKPVAECGADGKWLVTSKCEYYHTSLGCQCEPSWIYCQNWFGKDCSEWFGCTYASEGFQWCHVKPGSCPKSASWFGITGIAPSWDFCSDGASVHEERVMQMEMLRNSTQGRAMPIPVAYQWLGFLINSATYIIIFFLLLQVSLWIFRCLVSLCQCWNVTLLSLRGEGLLALFEENPDDQTSKAMPTRTWASWLCSRPRSCRDRVCRMCCVRPTLPTIFRSKSPSSSVDVIDAADMAAPLLSDEDDDHPESPKPWMFQAFGDSLRESLWKFPDWSCKNWFTFSFSRATSDPSVVANGEGCQPVQQDRPVPVLEDKPLSSDLLVSDVDERESLESWWININSSWLNVRESLGKLPETCKSWFTFSRSNASDTVVATSEDSNSFVRAYSDHHFQQELPAEQAPPTPATDRSLSKRSNVADRCSQCDIEIGDEGRSEPLGDDGLKYCTKCWDAWEQEEERKELHVAGSNQASTECTAKESGGSSSSTSPFTTNFNDAMAKRRTQVDEFGASWESGDAATQATTAETKQCAGLSDYPDSIEPQIDDAFITPRPKTPSKSWTHDGMRWQKTTSAETSYGDLCQPEENNTAETSPDSDNVFGGAERDRNSGNAL